MEYQNNLKNEFKQIRPLGPDAAHDRTAPLDQALWRPAKPAHPGTESGLTRPSRLTGSPMAEVHRQDYVEHKHLLTHSPGTHTTAGSS
jgi:hypothetical protein